MDRFAGEVALDIVGEAFYGGVTPRWIFLQGAKDDRVQVSSKMALAPISACGTFQLVGEAADIARCRIRGYRRE